MNQQFLLETERLRQSWMRHDQNRLAEYLVQDVQNPCINTASILTRHFFIREQFGDTFDSLMFEELRFAAVLNYLGRNRQSEYYKTYREAIRCGLLPCQDQLIPDFLLRAFSRLPFYTHGIRIDNYIWKELLCNQTSFKEEVRSPVVHDEFEKIWNSILRGMEGSIFSVLEVGCGSANDYRFLHSFGIARFLDYTGIDLCEKNIANAKERFPRVCFRVGNVLQIEANDSEYDYCFVHDLLEHLSSKALKQAISEICRVARKAVVVGFFNVHNGKEHIIRRVGHYHWNTLSGPRLCSCLESLGMTVDLVCLSHFMEKRFSRSEEPNPNAHFLVARL